MIYKCKYVNKVELSVKAYVKSQEDNFKLYLSDMRILTVSLEIEFSKILLNEKFMFKGDILENYTTQEFRTNNISLSYWFSGNKAWE